MKEGFNVIEEIQVPSDFDHLGQIESLIDRSCAEAGVDEDSYGNVLIAVTEAFNNAVVHGNKNDASKNVRVSVAHNEEELCFVLADEGLGFDFDNVGDPKMMTRCLELSEWIGTATTRKNDHSQR